MEGGMRMPDREKVIKGLEHCRKTSCESCPYNAADVKSSNPICLINEMLSDALALLKEQEAVVRCKDCRHYNIIGCAGGFGWCERYDVGHTDEWFCADGKKGKK